MKAIFRILYCLGALCCSVPGWAGVRLPRLVSDGMVLQRDVPLRIWGWADAGERVQVAFLGKSYSTRADGQGNWSVTLPAAPAGGPYTMRVGGIELADILVGDVWVCSGQSNMEFPLERVMDMFSDELKATDYPMIRHFRVPITPVFGHTADDVASGSWQKATPGNLDDFSAVGFFFGVELHKQYGIPVGLITNAVGGSPAEAWVSDASIKKYPGHGSRAVELARAGYVDSVRNAEGELARAMFGSMGRGEPAVEERNMIDFDDSDWEPISMPGYWREKGVGSGAGTIWLRKEVFLPDELAGRESILRLGVVVDSDTAWVNGQFVGTVGYQYPPRIYKVPSGVLRAGHNVIAVRVTSFGRGGFVEEKPYKLIVGRGGAWDEGGVEFDLTGDWKYQLEPPVAPSGGGGFGGFTSFQYQPTGLYNGMLAPLANYAAKGFLWYQGESNTGRVGEYTGLMSDVVSDWRVVWGNPAMPFLSVQLTSFQQDHIGAPGESGWAGVRDVQRRLLSIPHTGMASTLDVGEWNDIHPLDKKTVGKRLFSEARRVAYGESGQSGSGPLPERAVVEKGAAMVDFLCVGADLYTNLRPDGFAIAGADRKFVWAHAAFAYGNTVRVWSDAVPEPVFVRYAWSDNPLRANLRDRAGVPVGSFEIEVDTVVTEDRLGSRDGYDWELWYQRGKAAMTPGSNGTFTGEWADSHNVLFRSGRKFLPEKPLESLGAISLDYGCDYRPEGNSYLCVYGWSVDPLIEFYIVDSWGTWRPPGAKSKGRVTIDGAKYDIYETTRVDMPSIRGNTTFKQYWSVRVERRTAGTVSIDRHFEAWAERGMKLGAIHEIALCVEGYESSGRAEVYKNVLKIDKL